MKQPAIGQINAGAGDNAIDSPSMVSPTLIRFPAPISKGPTSVPEPHFYLLSSAPPTEDPAARDGLAATPPCTLPCSVSDHAVGTQAAGCIDPAPSPVAWLPAEEVLPVEAEEELALSISRVYVRRQRRRDDLIMPQSQEPAVVPTAEPANTNISPPDQNAVFISRVSRALDTALPVPAPSKRRRLTAAITAPPRRSRRIANLPPEVNQAATSACKRLGFTGANSCPSKEEMDKYQEFFAKPLSREHIIALASMLGKEVPEEAALTTSEGISVT